MQRLTPIEKKLVLDTKITVAEVAKRIGRSKASIYQMRSQAKRTGAPVEKPTSTQTLNEKLVSLQQEQTSAQFKKAGEDYTNALSLFISSEIRRQLKSN